MIREKVINYWPVIIILVIVAFFSRPYIQKGLIPLPADHLVTSFAPWQYYYASPVKNNAMPDVVSQMFPFKHLVIGDWKKGIVPSYNSVDKIWYLHGKGGKIIWQGKIEDIK